MNIAKTITDLIGSTPLVQLNRVTEGATATVVAKLESRTRPAASRIDRRGDDRGGRARWQDQARRNGVIEPTSGNTGIGLAFVPRSRDTDHPYDAGDDEPRTPYSLRPRRKDRADARPQWHEGAIAKAEEMLRETPNSFIPQQFNNPANPKIHFETTGPEIWNDTDGKTDILVSGVGTGGTLTGVSQYIKTRKPASRRSRSSRQTARCSPAANRGRTRFRESALALSRGAPNRVDRRSVQVTNDEAFNMARRLPRKKVFGWDQWGRRGGCRCSSGTTSGNAGKLIVVILPDLGERYLSTGLFDELRQQALGTPTATLTP